ncbi:MAG: helix-turn-helix domain-containing protein [Deltaproteobacteria bacterium]|nr:helix-turn-helix domain-containing protein [Deltaproteobacteria bacterium]
MELLTVEELSELLKVSRNQIVLMANRREIPALSVFGKLRFDANEIEEWLKHNRLYAKNETGQERNSR